MTFIITFAEGFTEEVWASNENEARKLGEKIANGFAIIIKIEKE